MNGMPRRASLAVYTHITVTGRQSSYLAPNLAKYQQSIALSHSAALEGHFKDFLYIIII